MTPLILAALMAASPVVAQTYNPRYIDVYEMPDPQRKAYCAKYANAGECYVKPKAHTKTNIDIIGYWLRGTDTVYVMRHPGAGGK